MTIEELAEMLSGLIPGQEACVPYEIYEEIFPPGEPDELAREMAFNFAREHGCRISHVAKNKEVCFQKPM
jgi:hypothetical protein